MDRVCSCAMSPGHPTPSQALYLKSVYLVCPMPYNLLTHAYPRVRSTPTPTHLPPPPPTHTHTHTHTHTPRGERSPRLVERLALLPSRSLLFWFAHDDKRLFSNNLRCDLLHSHGGRLLIIRFRPPAAAASRAAVWGVKGCMQRPKRLPRYARYCLG